MFKVIFSRTVVNQNPSSEVLESHLYKTIECLRRLGSWETYQRFQQKHPDVFKWYLEYEKRPEQQRAQALAKLTPTDIKVLGL